jgi:hypothetical protein
MGGACARMVSTQRQLWTRIRTQCFVSAVFGYFAQTHGHISRLNVCQTSHTTKFDRILKEVNAIPLTVTRSVMPHSL